MYAAIAQPKFHQLFFQVSVSCDLTQRQFVISNKTQSPWGQKSNSQYQWGREKKSISFGFCWHTNETVAQDLSSYKVRAAVWWDLYTREAVCLSPSLCRNLQTHLARHKQWWPGKIVEIPLTYQQIWGFGLTIHTNTQTTRDRGVGNGRGTGSGSKCVGLTDIDTNEWYQLTHTDADTNSDTMATWVTLIDRAKQSKLSVQAITSGIFWIRPKICVEFSQWKWRRFMWTVCAHCISDTDIQRLVPFSHRLFPPSFLGFAGIKRACSSKATVQCTALTQLI